MIWFITGSSGVGKSTLARELKTSLSRDFAAYDFDEGGVPDGADRAWRIRTTEGWIQTAKENQSENISTIIVGLTHPEEVNEIAMREQVEVRYIMLEVEPEELKRRLMAVRFSSPERIENLKKYEGVTPEEFFENNQQYVQQLRSEALKYDAEFIDTTNKSYQEVVQEVLGMIQNKP